ncbi:class I SAM-dependent methyltransferase [Mycolicibacterium psychrotolerans]|uniref:class I SAM-dependent methyltransferase n=1 Tax=Mycolicibacterium psychrotolerans TaxID=216929 RepID=UPI001FE71A82|nr:class I SAM-dependent methyltransferase [Mycolicibacterium psychrotolerans]
MLDRDVAVVHGVEMSETMLTEAKRRFSDPIARGRLRLYSGRMESLPLEDSALDAIISTNTIYFVPDLAAAMSELVRVLRPGGRLVLGVGDPGRMSRMPFTRQGSGCAPSTNSCRSSARQDSVRSRTGASAMAKGRSIFWCAICRADVAAGDCTLAQRRDVHRRRSVVEIGVNV